MECSWPRRRQRARGGRPGLACCDYRPTRYIRKRTGAYVGLTGRLITSEKQNIATVIPLFCDFENFRPGDGRTWRSNGSYVHLSLIPKPRNGDGGETKQSSPLPRSKLICVCYLKSFQNNLSASILPVYFNMPVRRCRFIPFAFPG